MVAGVPEQLGGRYEVGDLLGRGGMAEVHLGRDTRLGRSVAVKMLRPDFARDPSFQARFRREAHSAASLNHPSVVSVYDTGEDEFAGNPVPYIVMEYVEGSTLRDLLGSGNKLVPERALEIVDGVLAALAYSHQQGIVHRDIKPANVMLTKAGDVKVMDFGIARAMDDIGATMTQTSAVIGTAQYLSPEQARGEQVDARSDLYSTGCLLYELLTGRPPFVGDSPVSVAYQHVREDPAPPSQLDPDVPPSADAIVLKALAKDPGDRYQTADDMRRDIAAALAGRPVAAMVPPPVAAADPGHVPHHRAAGDHDDAGGRRPATEPRSRAATAGAGGRSATRCSGSRSIAVFVIAALIARSLIGEQRPAGHRARRARDHVGGRPRPPLEAEGLTLGDQTEKPDKNVAEGDVIDQSPESGNRIDEGSAVNVVVSTGVEETTVPTLVGLSLDQARQALHERRPRAGRHEAEAVGPGPQHRAQGEPERGRDGAGRQPGRRRPTPAATTRCPTSPATARPTPGGGSSRRASPSRRARRRSRPTPSPAPCCAPTPRPARPSGWGPRSRSSSPPRRPTPTRDTVRHRRRRRRRDTAPPRARRRLTPGARSQARVTTGPGRRCGPAPPGRRTRPASWPAAGGHPR